MAQGQRELEQAWEELTWRAREAGSVVRRQPRLSDRQWGRVQEFVDALNEFGRDPSGAMDYGREMAEQQKAQQCEDFAAIMAEWKEKVLADLRERDEWLNLAESGCTSGRAVDTFGDGCDWYDRNPDGCGNYDHEGFTAARECCACGGGVATPEWFLDLDYDKADEYSRELEERYAEHHAEVADILTRWGQARDEVDRRFWDAEFLPLLAEGERLDERAMRTVVTWVAEGTEIKGKPLVEVFPEVEEWMLDNYQPEALTVVERFSMEQMPMMLQAREPMTFTFHFDEAAIMEYLEREGRIYEELNTRYTTTWEDYQREMAPLFEQWGVMNQGYKRQFEQIDGTLQAQLEQSAADIQHWFDESFSVTLAAKLDRKKHKASTSSSFGMYAAVGATTLAAMFIAGLAYKNKKSGNVTNSFVSEALVN